MVKFMFNELTWAEVNDFAREGKVVLLPVGAIEQHGPHLPLDTDNVGAEAICRRAAQREPSLLVCMPTVHYGFNEQGLDFPGTISITENNFVGYIFDLCASLTRMGFRKIVIVNGHGGNACFLEAAARLVTARTPALAAMVGLFGLGQRAVEEAHIDMEGGHAGDLETSIYLACAPNLVKMELRIRETPGARGRWFWGGLAGHGAVRMMNHASRLTVSGVAGNPTDASAEKGEAFLAAAVDDLIDLAREFQALPIKPRISHLLGAEG